MGMTTSTPYPLKAGYYEMGFAEFDKIEINSKSQIRLHFGMYVDEAQAAKEEAEFTIAIDLDDNDPEKPNIPANFDTSIAGVAAAAEVVFLDVVADEKYTKLEQTIEKNAKGIIVAVHPPSIPAWIIPGPVAYTVLEGPWSASGK